MKIYLIHGFNVSDEGEHSLGWLRDHLKSKGYDVKMIKYGWMFRLRVRLCNSRIAKVIASIVEPNSVAIGHSNGCDLIYRACEEGAAFKKVILFHPALDSDTVFPRQVEQVVVFHSPSDKATGLAKWIPFSNWGSMGNTGFTGNDRRYIKYNVEDITRKKMGHTDFAEYPVRFGKIVERLL